MVEYITPFARKLGLDKGIITDAVLVQQRWLSDLRGLYADAAAEAARAAENPLVYEVFEATINPVERAGFVTRPLSFTRARSATNYCFTKGHYHAKGECAEIYTGITGTGLLLMQTPAGEVHAIEMTRGVAAYVPPYWAHRTINIGTDNFSFYACYPSDAGYDYASIAEKGFAGRRTQWQAAVNSDPKWAR